MNLAEFAFSCYVFGISTKYDADYLRFVRQTTPSLDLNQELHRRYLLQWLNKWGCRQFAKKYHGEASMQIKDWFDNFGVGLFPAGKSLLFLTDSDFNLVEFAYSALIDRIASKRALKGREIEVKFGPAGAAKILFAFRPEALIPWDDPIRDDLGFDGSAGSYRQFLENGKRFLCELNGHCKAQGFELVDLPVKVGRPQSSVAKLIDEYLWIKVTKHCEFPKKELFERWTAWGSVSFVS